LVPLLLPKTFSKRQALKASTEGRSTSDNRLDSALMRQAIYTTARFGIFLNMQDYLKSRQEGKNLSLTQKAICSLTAGGLGSFVGTPADLILIRIQSDSMLPPEQRRNYKSVFDAAKRIPKEEGITALWQGGVPTITRAMALNLGMFTTYQEAKERLQRIMPERPQTANSLASMIAGCAAATMSLPFDNAKTKM
jgi:solute carrier family 25 oxoglutarate transporter 11